MGSIIGAVANSMQESQIIIQLLYFPMLFLGGATFPIAIMPNWLQIVAQFIPSTYLSTGMHGDFAGPRNDLGQSGAGGSAVADRRGRHVPRVETVPLGKRRKDARVGEIGWSRCWRRSIAMGVWQAYAKDNVVKGKMLAREMSRSRTILIRDARLFIGDGNVIEQGAVLVKDGKIAEIYTGSAPDPKTLKAEAIDAAGKTLMPGLIDVHVHLGSPGGFYDKRRRI